MMLKQLLKKFSNENQVLLIKNPKPNVTNNPHRNHIDKGITLKCL